MLLTPILLIVFNRPDKTAVVFEKIRQQRPSKLYIAADGPREDRAGETEKCEAVRALILKGIDWDCEVKTLFRDQNLGCGLGPSQAITWFFEYEENGIILEDDCVPNLSFFTFCQELLIKYAADEKIMMITGFSIQDEPMDEFTYYLSWYVHVWGWATWKRAWKQYDFDVKGFNEVDAEVFLKKIFKKKKERAVWIRNFSSVYYKLLDTWDYQWMYAIWKNQGKVISPWRNLISNIGYGADATHTPGYETHRMNLPTYAFDNLKHPLKLKINANADEFTRYKLIINKITLKSIIKKVIRKIIKKVNA